MQKILGACEVIEGVGWIWREDGRWCFQTLHGATGKCKDKSQARTRMECIWATDSRKAAGVYDYPGHRISESQRSLWASQEDLIRRAWK